MFRSPTESLLLPKQMSLHADNLQCNEARITSKLANTAYSKTVLDYTGCPRKNVPDFGRVFLMLKYTDITQNTCIQS